MECVAVLTDVKQSQHLDTVTAAYEALFLTALQAPLNSVTYTYSCSFFGKLIQIFLQTLLCVIHFAGSCG